VMLWSSVASAPDTLASVAALLPATMLFFRCSVPEPPVLMPPPPEAETLDELNPYAVEARYGLVNLSGLDRHKFPMTVRPVLAWVEERIG